MYAKNGNKHGGRPPNIVSKRGSSPDLMPSIMGAFDVFMEKSRVGEEGEGDNTAPAPATARAGLPRRSQQAGNFTCLSARVQKILSNVPDEELSRHFSSEEVLGGPRRGLRPVYRSLRSPDRCTLVARSKRSPEKLFLHQHQHNRSNESLNIISPNVQKMLSNFPETELILPTTASTAGVSRNASFLHQSRSESALLLGPEEDGGACDSAGDSGVNACCECDRLSVREGSSDRLEAEGAEDCCDYSPKPLGSYLHTSPHGIASRTPVGRKHLGKFLQVPSECSAGTTSSTASSEVSRPVSLTSLGSCSSSSSSGPNQPCSAYLASTESLDTDTESHDRQGSADSGIAEQVTPSSEARVLQEVLDTETVYVEALSEVIQGYLNPWKGDQDCPLQGYLPDLFSNLEQIYNFNRSFLNQLQEADCDPTKTANVFIQNDHGFSVYSEYCTNYPRTMTVLSELTRDDAMAALFREKQVALGHALPLGSYLLKPVQRILKYHLLLQRLSKQCEPGHRPAVNLALTTMTSVASSINNMKRKHEHAVRVHEIQSQLYGWPGPDLTTLGELIAEGSFRMNGARARRHVFLFDKLLLIAKNKEGGGLAYKLHINCSNLMLVEQVRREPLSFQILPFDNPRLQCTLRARSPQHKREWTLQIKRVILENYSAVIPNHARQLVMQLGQDVHETEDTQDKWLSLNNKHSTPHYLERRSRVRKSRTLTNGISNCSNNRRTSSQDLSFPSLGSWRRKSEPAMVNVSQYNTKTVPKKISKLKKAKEGQSAKFYTDLSDSENCDATIGESTENIAIGQGEGVDTQDSPSGNAERDETDIVNKTVGSNLEKIVSDLLMQNNEFHKVLMSRPRKSRASEPEVSVWLAKEKTKVNKADSLPRSFQLNDQVDKKDGGGNGDQHSVLNQSLKEDDNSEDRQNDNDLSSQLDDHDYPVHKIYRKSAIRLSLVQRIRALVSEEQRRVNSATAIHKQPSRNSNVATNHVHKQGSEAMGEKIAHPDYVDPQKLFLNCGSRTSLVIEAEGQEEDEEVEEEEEEEEEEDVKRLDMTISEKEVLSELERRLSTTDTSPPHNSNCDNSSSQQRGDGEGAVKVLVVEETRSKSQTTRVSSSPSSDGYYESILETSLKEEYTRDERGRLVLKSDSFRNGGDTVVSFYTVQKYRGSEAEGRENKGNGGVATTTTATTTKRPTPPERKNSNSSVKRPTRAPPPIPTKPTHLTNGNFAAQSSRIERLNAKNAPPHHHPNNNVASNITSNGSSGTCNKTFLATVHNGNDDDDDGENVSVQKGSHQANGNGTSSWVKAMVGRFE